MSSIGKTIISNLAIINTFRSSSYIADKLEVKSEIIKDILSGNFETIGITVEEFDEVIRQTFEAELEVGTNENAILKFKSKIVNRIIELEDSLGIDETRHLLGKSSLTVYKKYKNGDMPNNQLFYINDMINGLKNHTVKDSGDSDDLDIYIFNEVPETEIQPKLNALKNLVLDNKTTSNDTEPPKKTAYIEQIDKGESNLMVNKKNGVASIIFKNIEKEIKNTFGDSVNIEKVTVENDKIIIESVIKTDED